MNFKTKLNNIVVKNKSLLCVGLDSDIDKIPKHIRSVKHPQFLFNKAIIDATADLVCAYKPNAAFYEAEGLEGLLQLKFTIDYLRKKYPDIPVILDAKRADIGNTNEGYVKFAFDFFRADALTVHPYLGKEALKPFLDRKDAGIFILCRTSNPGAGEFQDLKVTYSSQVSPGRSSLQDKPFGHLPGVSGKDTSQVSQGDSWDGGGISKPFYQVIAEHVVKDWNCNNNCGLVVGATYPTELTIVRRIVGDGFPLLVPGIGTQGGDVEKTIKAGIDESGKNAIINVSRNIIFAGESKDFAQRAREETEKLQQLINNFR